MVEGKGVAARFCASLVFDKVFQVCEIHPTNTAVSSHFCVGVSMMFAGVC